MPLAITPIMLKASAIAALVLVAAAPPASGQVRAVFGVSVVYAAPRPVMVRRAPAPAVLVVNRVPRRGRGWWARNGYRPANVYTDGRYYYNGWTNYPRVTQVTVYTRDGQYLMEIRGH